MTCIYCDRTDETVPLIIFDYKGKQYKICPEHLPILIHKPEMLVGKLEEAGAWSSGEDHHHHD